MTEEFRADNWYLRTEPFEDRRRIAEGQLEGWMCSRF